MTRHDPAAPIAIVGSVNMDVAAYLERLPRPGETLAGTDYRLGLGGKGANQAVAVARLGHTPIFVARLGQDDFGHAAARALSSHGVDNTYFFYDVASPTGIALITVAMSGENAIAIVPGANANLSLADVAARQADLGKSRVLLLQLETPLATSLAAARIVHAAGGTVILDPAPAPAQALPPEVLQLVDVVTPNETESAALLGTAPSDLCEGLAAARTLVKRGFATAVVKLGARGLAYATAKTADTMPAFKVKAIDTVAAGDCFNGGLAHGLAEGMPLPEALRFAQATAALSTTLQGAASAAPTLAEVETFLTTAQTV
ncbi:MAG TPA: ribokinase [Aestuariivirga sp.]|nr:ribokinase [Aestuariivirga sp.]